MQNKDFSEDFNFAARQKWKERDYWLTKLSGNPVKSSIPYDFNEASPNKNRNSSFKFKMTGKIFSRLMEISNHSDIRLFIILVAVLNVLLSKYSYDSGKDIIVGTSIYKQEKKGKFINTVLTLRNKLENNVTFREFLLQVGQTLREAVENQNYPIENLLRELDMPVEENNFPLFDIFILLENIHNRNYIKHIKSNITFTFYRIGECIEGKLQYNPCLYRKTTMQTQIKYFRYLLQETIFAAETRVSEIDLLSQEEKERILREFNNADHGYPRDKTIHELFEMQVEQTPDHIALIGKNPKTHISNSIHSEGTRGLAPLSVLMSITYEELNEKSNQLAYLLHQKGVAPDIIVAIMMERSIGMIIGILGILKAGGAYLPIDPKYPEERIQYMLKDSNAEILLTGKEIAFSQKGFNNRPEGASSHLHLQLAPATSLAYIIYTSGTTGKPKGVMIEHENVVRLLFNDEFPFDFNENDVWTMFHSYCFDFSVWEMFGALLYGAKLIIVPKQISIDPLEFLKILMHQGVTVLNQTPASFYNLSDIEIQLPKYGLKLRYIIFGGERLNPTKLRNWKNKYPGTKLINMYGITETTVHVTFKIITRKDMESDKSNIGKPIPTLSAYVMDKNLHLLPIGVPGELCVGGKGVCRGYLNSDALAKEKFVENPYVKGERLYRSGDLARFVENTDLEYLGRIDDQVKIRGYRVELQEIAIQLLTYQRIKESVVLTKEDKAGVTFLIAYFVSDRAIDKLLLRDYLANVLPDYMIPPHFVQIEKIPLTSNGKVDRQALIQLDAQWDTGIEYISPRNETEKIIAQIWMEVLQLDKVGINDNFFDVGGNSIHMIRVNAKLRSVLKQDIDIMAMFEYPTIDTYARYLSTGPEMNTDITEEVKAVKREKLNKTKNRVKKIIKKKKSID